MKPSSLSTWAIFSLRRVVGISTAGRSMRLALRMRVSMSAIGSVIMAVWSLPARLHHAGDEAVAGHVAEADASYAELAVHRPRPAAQPAAEADADALARLHFLGRVGLFPAGLQGRHLAAEFHGFGFGTHNRFYSLGYFSSRKGMPKFRSSSRASSSLFVLVTKVMSMPWVNVTLSGSISGNTICSDRPRL